MKNRTRNALVLLIAGSLLIPASILAKQNRQSADAEGFQQGPPSAEQKLYRLDRALDLSDEQSAQLLRILQDAHAEKQALHEQIMNQFGPAMCDLKNATEAEIEAILTSEQLELMAEHKSRRQERGGQGIGDIDC